MIGHILNIFLNNFIEIWTILEFINWLIYLFMYLKIINPSTLYYRKNDIKKIISKIDKLDKFELEHIIKGSIAYNKITHKNIDYENFDVKEMTQKEMMLLLGHTLYGIEIDKVFASKKIKQIHDLMLKIEKKLDIKFKMENVSRYIYKSWGREFIYFHFRPLLFEIPIRITMNLFHLYMRYLLKFKYKICDNSKIGYFYKENVVSKDNLIFIHGFGLGYIPYIKKIIELDKKFNLIIMVLPNISSYTYYDDIHCGYFPSHESIKKSFYDTMNKLNIKKINILAHSFGTYVTQILRKDKQKNIINKIIMIDPIIFWIGCFKMSLYIDKIAEFGTNIFYWLIELLTNYLIYKCLYLRYVCYRVMFGPDFLVYDSVELENENILFVLEYNDKVIPADIIYDKIKNKNTNYFYINNAEHGSILLDSKFNTIFNEILNYYD